MCPVTAIENAIEQQFGQKLTQPKLSKLLPRHSVIPVESNDLIWEQLLILSAMQGDSNSLASRLLELKRSSHFQPEKPAPAKQGHSTSRDSRTNSGAPIGSNIFLEHYQKKMRQNTNNPTVRTDSKQQEGLSSSRMSVRSHQPLTRRSNHQQESQDSAPNQAYIDNLVKLKLEETNFRIKSRIATMLKEMAATPTELGRFSLLSRTEDMLDCLSEHIRDKLSSTQIRENSIQKERSKEKQSMAEAEIQLEALRKKAQERQTSEKELRKKLKDSNSELKVLYEQVNVKEKELSQRITELYQTRTLLKEAEKHSQSLMAKYMTVEKQRDGLRQAANNDSKNNLNEQKTLSEQVSKLQEQNSELREELQMMKVREKSQSMTVNNLNDEVERWRQRFQLQQNSSKKEPKDASAERLKEKMQKMAEEWKDKLTSLVETYENEKEQSSSKIAKLNQEKEQLKNDKERLLQQVNSIPTPQPATMVKRQRLGSFDADLDLGQLGRQITH